MLRVSSRVSLRVNVWVKSLGMFVFKIKIRIEIDVTYTKILVWLSSLGDI